MSNKEKITFTNGKTVTGEVLNHDGKILKVKLDSGNVALFDVQDMESRSDVKPKKARAKKTPQKAEETEKESEPEQEKDKQDDTESEG